MSEMTFACGTTVNGLLNTYIYDVNIPYYDKFLKENTYHVSQTKRHYFDNKPEDELRVNLKFIFRRFNNIIDIYYQSLDPVVVMLELMLKYTKNTNYGAQENYYSILNTEHHAIEANKWQHLKKFNRTDFISLYKIQHVFLKFKFNMIIANENVNGALGNDFENLLNHEMFSDMMIISADNIKYKAHKAVLASRCSVMKAHFEHDTKEGISNIIECAFESEVLKEILTFIYSDKAPRVNEIPEKLLPAADFYQLSRLKRMCEEALYMKLTVDNAIEALQLADLHSAESLIQLTAEYIKDQANLIIKTEGWAQFNSVKLVKMIFEELMMDDVMVNEIKYYDVKHNN